jgi:CP family cyanate transporter-like MFS transporter
VRRSGAHHLLLAGLFAASLSLRPQIVAVGPLLPSIQHGLDISHSVAGLLPTIVVLCMGVFAPVSVVLANRIGSRASISIALALIGVFGVARALVPSVAFVIVLTVPVGIGVAVAGTLMPRAVKEAWPERPAFATGVYATGISLGAAVSAALAVPLASLAWGWRGSLTVLSAFSALLLVVWLVLTARQPPHTRDEHPPHFPWRSIVGWRLVAIFALTSIAYYGITAWLPSVYVDRGWSHSSAGGLITVISVVTLPVSLLIAWAGDHHGSRRLYLTSGAVLLFLTGIGIVELPDGAWVWATLIGIWVGMTFPSLMTMPLDVGTGAREVASMAAMMLGVGYAVSSLAPFAFGAVRDSTGSFTAVLWLIVGTAGLLAIACLFAPRRRVAPQVSRRTSSTAAMPSDSAV